MSMNGSFRALSPQAVEAVRKDPELIAALIAPSFAAAPSPALLAIPGMKEHFEQIARARASMERKVPADQIGPVVEIDKAWHGVHFVLTGTADDTDSVLGGAVLGGDEIGEDAGYGPPRIHDPDEVKQIAEALQTFDDHALATRYDADVMSDLGIYPDVWSEDGEELDWLADAVETVKNVYADAANKGWGLLMWLS